MAGRIISAQNFDIDIDSRSLIKSIQFEMDIAEGVIIYGDNNSAKTLFCETLYGRHHELKGILKVCDYSMNPISESDKSSMRRKIGYLSQHNALLLHKTVRVNLNLAIQASDRIKDSAPDQTIMEHLHYFHLDHLVKREVESLSFSEQRLVAIVRCLVHRPKLILMDSLTLGLDNERIALVMDKLEQLRQRDNLSYVLFDHTSKLGFYPNMRSYEIKNQSLRPVN